MTQYLDWFRNNEEKIHGTFLALHSMPELGFQEVKTSSYIADRLNSWGFQVKSNFAKTAVLGILSGVEPGPSVCLRADMDALPFYIDGKSCCIHACGHDANTAVVLSVAEAAAEAGFPKKGELIVLFQPCEEKMEGALAVLESGALSRIDYLFSMHLRPSSEIKWGACPAIMHGSTAVSRVDISGKVAHASKPEEGINAITAGAKIIDKVSRIEPRDATPFSLKATRFLSAQGAINIIPAGATVYFDLRAQTNSCMQWLKGELEQIIAQVEKEMGVENKIEYLGEVPAAQLSENATQYARNAIIDVCGEEFLHDPVITPGGDDFHQYMQVMPNISASILGFGASMVGGLHNPMMSFDHDILAIAAEVLATISENILA